MGVSISQLLIIMVFLPLALLPTIIAIRKKHHHKVPIILVNILGGLFWGIGWFVALVWCFIEPGKGQNTQTNNTASEIEKLHELMEKGVLTQEEFDSKKKMLLEA